MRWKQLGESRHFHPEHALATHSHSYTTTRVRYHHHRRGRNNHHRHSPEFTNDIIDQRTDHSTMTTIVPPILHRHNSQHTPLTPAQEQSRQSYLSTPDLVKYAAIDRVLDRRGGRTDEAFVGGEEVSQESESKSSSFGRGPGRREEPY